MMSSQSYFVSFIKWSTRNWRWKWREHLLFLGAFDFVMYRYCQPNTKFISNWITMSIFTIFVMTWYRKHWRRQSGGNWVLWLRMPDCRSCHIASPAALTLAIHCFCLSLQPCLATKQTAFHKDQQIKHVWIRHESRVCVRDFEIKGVPESSRVSVYFELRVQREEFLKNSEWRGF